MRIVNFDKGDGKALGFLFGDEVVDLSLAAPDLPGDLGGLIAAGPGAFEQAAAAAEKATARLNLAELSLRPPIENPPKILCIGRNYAAHAREGGAEPPSYPDIFMRSRLSMIGHGQPIVRPKLSEQLDFEGELLAVIGKTVSKASEAEALDAVVGYSLFNDATLRNYQRQTTQWTIGKNFDNTGACGPAFITPDEIPAGAVGLRLQTRLNGEVMQDANTDDMIFPVATAISIMSQTMTLEAGDIIATGTPEGVGYARNPPVWMKPGDVCEVEVEGVGVLSNPIVDEA